MSFTTTYRLQLIDTGTRHFYSVSEIISDLSDRSQNKIKRLCKKYPVKAIAYYAKKYLGEDVYIPELKKAINAYNKKHETDIRLFEIKEL